MVDVSAKVQGEVSVIVIAGELYLDSIDFVEDIWKKQLEKNPRIIGIDCSQIAFIDSSGIGAFVKFLNNSTKLNIKLIFFDLSKTFAYLFKTARLNKFFTTMTRKEFERNFL